MPTHAKNLGTTRLKTRRRRRDPMRQFDALPAPLRQWMAQAALPWSPESCQRIWSEATARGDTTREALARLSRAEARLLAREGQTRGLRA